MIKVLGLIAVGVGAGFDLWADSFQMVGIPFPPPNVEIVWKASVTNLPTGLWTYKVIPREFSMAVISNAMTIGSFEMLNIINPRDTNTIQFRDKKDASQSMRSLKINPSQGLVEYESRMPSAENREIPAGVPNEEDGVKLGWHYLFLLGIDRSQVFNNPRAHVDIETRSKQNQITWQGAYKCTVGFDRCIDGIRAYGGNFHIVFRNNSKVEELDLSWPGLMPYESHSLANENEIIGFIKNGQAVLPVPEFDFGNLSGMKKLTITKITPYYFFEPARDGLFHPFAELEMTADLEDTNFNFQLRCPILTANNPKLN